MKLLTTILILLSSLCFGQTPGAAGVLYQTTNAALAIIDTTYASNPSTIVTTSVTTTSRNLTGATDVYVWLACSAGVTTTLTDNVSSTYSVVATVTSTSGTTTTAYHARLSGSLGSVIIKCVGPSGTAPSIFCISTASSNGGVVDVIGSNFTNSTGSSWTSATITPNFNNELIVSGGNMGNPGGMTAISSPYLVRCNIPIGLGTHWSLGVGLYQQSTATATSCTMTYPFASGGTENIIIGIR